MEYKFSFLLYFNIATKPVLMAAQATPSSQAVPANKHTLLTKSLHARASITGQANTQTQGIGVASLSQQQVMTKNNKLYILSHL